MPRFAANLAFLYPDLPFLDRFAAAAADGFCAVEYPVPYDWPVATLRDLLDAHGLGQALFNMPAGDWHGGERGIACHPGREAEFRAGVDMAIAYAAALDCPTVNCLAGIGPEGTSLAERDAVFVENLRYAAPRLAAAGVRLVIEPINRGDIPGFHLADVEHAERLIAVVGEPNLMIQFDFYHMQIVRGDLLRSFERLQSLIGHVQIADVPGRNEPGTGEINYGVILAALDRLGYAGWVGCEYRPSSGSGADLDWLRRLQAGAA